MSREKHKLNIDILIDNLIGHARNNKTETYNEKWWITDDVLPVT